jgi:hypothetical protein
LGQRRALLDFVAPRGGAAAQPEPGQAQQVRFAEVARALSVLAGNLAARRGLIVAVDDAERLSAGGRELLGLWLAGLRDAAVGVVLLGRDDEDGTWSRAVTAARPGTVCLPLGPLPEQAIGSWLSQVRATGASGEEIRLLAEATGGEPVRIRDRLAAAAATAAAGPQVPSAWLAAAAITADDLVIDTALVARMLGLTDADADREERNARRMAWIDTSAGVRFTHGSHRDELIARLETDPALRRSLHRRAFLALSERVRGADDPDARLPVRIAGHALGADRDFTAAEAARAFLAAARAERASGEAAEGWARAGIAKDPPDQGTRASLRLALGDALDQRGADTDADREYQLAYDIAAGRPLDQAEALIRLARRWTDPGKLDWFLLSGLRDGIAALAEADFGDDQRRRAGALRLQLTAHLARKSTLAVPVLGTEADGMRGEGVRLARAALAQVDAAPPAAACEVLNECRWALFDYDPPADTIRLSERLERESLLARSPHFHNAALMTLAVDQLRLGQVTEAQGTLLAHERTPAGLRCSSAPRSAFPGCSPWPRATTRRRCTCSRRSRAGSRARRRRRRGCASTGPALSSATPRPAEYRRARPRRPACSPRPERRRTASACARWPGRRAGCWSSADRSQRQRHQSRSSRTRSADPQGRALDPEGDAGDDNSKKREAPARTRGMGGPDRRRTKSFGITGFGFTWLAQAGRQLRERLEVARREPAALADQLHEHVVAARFQVPGDPGE